MAITQSRIIALISAADEYRAAFAGLRRITAELAEQIARGELAAEAMSMQLALAMQGLTPSEDSIATIAREREHFRVTRSQNEAAAMRARRVRKEKELGTYEPQPLPAERKIYDRAEPSPKHQLAATAAPLDREELEAMLRAAGVRPNAQGELIESDTVPDPQGIAEPSSEDEDSL